MQLTSMFPSEISTHTSDKGRITFQSQKEFGIANNLKGQALKRAHFEYRVSGFGKSGNASLASAMTRGEIVVRSVSKTATGRINVSFDNVALLTAPADKRQSADKATISSLEARLAELQAELAAK